MRRSKLQRTDGSRELARCAGADIFSPAERRPGAGHDGRQGRFCGDLLPNGRRRPRSYTCGGRGETGAACTQRIQHFAPTRETCLCVRFFAHSSLKTLPPPPLIVSVPVL